jgi:hypothetical protein
MEGDSIKKKGEVGKIDGRCLACEILCEKGVLVVLLGVNEGVVGRPAHSVQHQHVRGMGEGSEHNVVVIK